MRNQLFRWLTPAAATFALLLSVHAYAEGQTVSGTVNGTDGKPAASIKVGLIKASDMPTGGGRRPGAAGDANAPKPEPKAADPAEPRKPGAGDAGGRRRPTPVGEATTDDKGAFAIKDVPAGEYFLVAGDRAAGAMAREKVTVAAGSDPAPVTLTLKAGGRRGGGAPGGEKPKAAEGAK